MSIRDLTWKPLCFIAAERRGTVEDFLYDVDIDGSSLLHLAVNSGVLGVSMRPPISSAELQKRTKTQNNKVQPNTK